jgi:hypothetical protein
MEKSHAKPRRRNASWVAQEGVTGDAFLRRHELPNMR